MSQATPSTHDPAFLEAKAKQAERLLAKLQREGRLEEAQQVSAMILTLERGAAQRRGTPPPPPTIPPPPSVPAAAEPPVQTSPEPPPKSDIAPAASTSPLSVNPAARGASKRFSTHEVPDVLVDQPPEPPPSPPSEPAPVSPKPAAAPEEPPDAAVRSMCAEVFRLTRRRTNDISKTALGAYLTGTKHAAFKDFLLKNFYLYDANHDGVISFDELLVAGQDFQQPTQVYTDEFQMYDAPADSLAASVTKAMSSGELKQLLSSTKTKLNAAMGVTAVDPEPATESPRAAPSPEEFNTPSEHPPAPNMRMSAGLGVLGALCGLADHAGTAFDSVLNTAMAGEAVAGGPVDEAAPVVPEGTSSWRPRSTLAGQSPLVPPWEHSSRLTPRSNPDVLDSALFATPKQQPEEESLPEPEPEPEPEEPPGQIRPSSGLFAHTSAFEFSVPVANLSEGALLRVIADVNTYISSLGEQLHVLPCDSRRVRLKLLSCRVNACKQRQALLRVQAGCDVPVLKHDIFVKPELWPSVLVSRAVAAMAADRPKAGAWFRGPVEAVSCLNSENVVALARKVMILHPENTVARVLLTEGYVPPLLAPLPEEEQRRLFGDTTAGFRSRLLHSTLQQMRQAGFSAAAAERMEGLQSLVFELVKDGVDVRAANGHNPFQLALQLEQPFSTNIAVLLLRHGASVHGSFTADSPFEVAFSQLLLAAEQDKQQMGQLVVGMIAVGALHEQTTLKHGTPLDLAIQSGELSVVRAVLEHGAPPDELALHKVVSQIARLCSDKVLLLGDEDDSLKRRVEFLDSVCAELLQAGSKIDCVVGGCTPLDLAVECGYKSLVVTLLAHGAHPHGGNLHSLPHHVVQEMNLNEDTQRAEFLEEVLGHLIAYGAQVNRQDSGAKLLLVELLEADNRAAVELVLAASEIDLDSHLQAAVEFISAADMVSELGSGTVCTLLRKGAHLKDSDVLLARVISHPGASQELVQLLVKQAQNHNPESMVSSLAQVMHLLEAKGLEFSEKDRLDRIGATIVNAGTPVEQDLLQQALMVRAQHLVHAVVANDPGIDFWEPTMLLLATVVDRAEAAHRSREHAMQRLNEISKDRVKASKLKGERSDRVLSILAREEAQLQKQLEETPTDEVLAEDSNTALALLKGIRDTEMPVPEGSDCDAQAISLALRHGDHSMLELVLQASRQAPKDQALQHITSQILDRESPPSSVVRAYLFGVLEACLQHQSDPTAAPPPGQHCGQTALEAAVAAHDEGCVSTLVGRSVGGAHQRALKALFDALVQVKLGESNATPRAENELCQLLHRVMKKAIEGTGVVEEVSDGGPSQSMTRDTASELLAAACQHGFTDLAILLLDQGAAPGGGSTLLNQMLLHGAASAPDETCAATLVVQHLMAANADLNEPDELGQRPLQVAMQTGAYEVVQLLVDCPEVEVSDEHLVYSLVQDMDGVPHDSNEWDLIQETLDKLIEVGASVTEAGPEGYHPIDLAICLGDNDLIWLLEVAGANTQLGYPVHAALNQLRSIEAACSPPTDTARVAALELAFEKDGWQDPEFVGSSEFRQCLREDVAGTLELDVSRVSVGQVQDTAEYYTTTVEVQTSASGQEELERTSSLIDEDISKTAPCNETVRMIKMKFAHLLLCPEAPEAKEFYLAGATGGIAVDRTLELLFGDCARLMKTILKLLREGACVGKPEGARATPLILAATMGQRTIAKAILSDAAQQLAVQDAIELMGCWLENPSGDSQLIDELIGGVIDSAGGSKQELQLLLTQACSAGLLSSCRQLLARGADASAGSNLNTVLGMLGKFPHLPYAQIARALLEHGADANAPDQAGLTPLEVCVGGSGIWPHRNSNQVHAAGLLVKFGAVFSDAIFRRTLSNWESATHPGLSVCLEQLVAEMVSRGVNYSIFTDANKSVVDLAVDKKSMSVTRAVLRTQQKRFDGALERSKGTFGFESLDGDSSGTVELSELVAQMGEDRAQTLFATLDADHDNRVSKHEWMSMITKPLMGLLIEQCRGHDHGLRSSSVLAEEITEEVDFGVELASALTASGEPALHELLRQCGPKAQEYLKVLLKKATAKGKARPGGWFLHCSIDIQVKDLHPPRRTLLHTACHHGLDEVARMLLDLRAEPGLQDDFGSDAFSLAIESGSDNVLSVLLDQHADKMPTGLLYKAALRASKSAITMVHSAGALLDQRDLFGRTALHACVGSHTQEGGKSFYEIPDEEQLIGVASLLAQLGATLDMQDTDGSTPLLLCVQAGYTQLAELLVQHKANPLVADVSGRSALDQAIVSDRFTAELLESMLQGCSVAQLAAAERSAVLAVSAGKSALLQQLRDCKAKAGSSNRCYQGWPLEWWACFYGQFGLLAELLSEENHSIGWVDHRGRTVLHWLAVWRVPHLSSTHAQCLQKLVDGEHVSLAVRDMQGSTAADLACGCGNAEVLDAMPQAPEDPPVDTAGMSLMSLMQASSSSEEAIQQAEQQAAAMTDPEFLPVSSSLSTAILLEPALAPVEWCRASKLGSTLFPSGRVNASHLPALDVGLFGKCWFWCVLAQLSDDAVRGAFGSTVLNARGYYRMSCHWEGQMRSVVVDDWIPCVHGQPAYGRLGGEEEVWSLLLCKAYAKLAGSYQQLFTLFSDKQTAATQAAVPELLGCHAEHAAVVLDDHHVGPAHRLLEHRLAPLLSLTDLLGAHSPGLEQQRAVADATEAMQRCKGLSEGLAALMVDAAGAPKLHRKAQAQQFPQLPRFELTCEQDCEMVVVVSGSPPADLYVTLTAADGGDAGTVELAEMQEGSEHWVGLAAAKCPYMINVNSGSSASTMPEFYLDFQSSKETDVTMLENSETEDVVFV